MLYIWPTLRPKTWTDCNGPFAGMFLKHTDKQYLHIKPANVHHFIIKRRPACSTYRLQLGCRTERPTGFLRQNITVCRTTIQTCFVAGFTTVPFAQPPFYICWVLMSKTSKCFDRRRQIMYSFLESSLLRASPTSISCVLVNGSTVSLYFLYK